MPAPIKSLSPNLQKLIQNKWDSLSLEAQNMILEISKDNEEYLNIAIKNAIRNDKEFPKKLSEFIRNQKRKKLIEIEEAERKLEEFNL